MSTKIVVTFEFDSVKEYREFSGLLGALGITDHSRDPAVPPEPSTSPAVVMEVKKRNRRTKAEIAAAQAVVNTHLQSQVKTLPEGEAHVKADVAVTPFHSADPTVTPPTKAPESAQIPPNAESVVKALQALGNTKGVPLVRDLIKEFKKADGHPANRTSDLQPVDFPFVLSRIAELMK